MKNLVIGNTSQLSNYFPSDYERISSRNINFDKYKNNQYDRVYICFSEQRTFLKNDGIFKDINLSYTINILSDFVKISNKIIVYGTSELWNKYNGAINVSLPFDYHSTPYIESKDIMVNAIKKLGMSNVIIVHPFNFNSIHRKEGFLFSKIFNSLLYNKKIEIGDTHFYRDLIHPKFVVDQSIKTDKDIIIGSGRLTFVNDFIRDLYKGMDMDYDCYVTENIKNNLDIKRNINYSDTFVSDYKKLLETTLYEIKRNKLSKEHH